MWLDKRQVLELAEEILHSGGKRQFAVLVLGRGDLEATLAGFQVQALAFLGFERFGRSHARGGALAATVLASFNEVAATRRPLDASIQLARKSGVTPPLGRANLLENIDPRHRAPSLKSGHFYGH